MKKAGKKRERSDDEAKEGDRDAFFDDQRYLHLYLHFCVKQHKEETTYYARVVD